MKFLFIPVSKCYGLSASYEEKLKALGLVSLRDRRMRGDMIQTFKILKGVDDVDHKSWFTKVSECHQRNRLAVSVSDEGDVVNSDNLLEPKSRLGSAEKLLQLQSGAAMEQSATTGARCG